MAKDPAFLFYPNDYLGGTMGMTFEMKGAYIDLLIFQFNNNHFTEAQAQQVLSICFTRVWDMLKSKFKKEGENGQFYFNERLRIEIEKRKAFSESRKINALQRGKSKKAYAEHMGNENENENKDINKDKKGSLRKYDFDVFWSIYPKKKSKGDAEKAWGQVVTNKEIYEAILKKIPLLKNTEDWQKENGQFIPYPATWLRAKGWEDEYEQWQPSTGHPADAKIAKLEEKYGKAP